LRLIFHGHGHGQGHGHGHGHGHGLGLLVVYFGHKVSVSKALFTNLCRVLIAELLNGD